MKNKVISFHVLSILLILTFLPTPFISSVSAEQNANVILNGEELIFDVQPQIINDRTMVPMRVIFEALGADVYFIGENENQFFKRIIAVKNDIMPRIPKIGQ